MLDILKNNKFNYHGKIDQQVIKKAETLLWITFPPSYNFFLSNYWCWDIQWIELFWITNDDFINSWIPDAIWLTLNERKNWLPNHFLIISDDWMWNYYVINTLELTQNNENPIYLYYIGWDIEKLYENYNIFLEDILN